MHSRSHAARRAEFEPPVKKGNTNEWGKLGRGAEGILTKTMLLIDTIQ